MCSFRPEPEPFEREVLELALERLLSDRPVEPAAYGSEWRRAALEEGVAGGDEDAGPH